MKTLFQNKKINDTFKLISLFYLLTVFFFSCTTTNVERASENSVPEISSLAPEWISQDSYFSTYDFYLEKEQSLCHSVKIDLTDPKLCITLFPSEQKASSLAQNHDITVNTIHWSQKIPLISKKIPVGILYSEGVTYSQPNGRYDSISFYKTETNGKTEYRAEISASQKSFTLETNDNPKIITGGFWQILSDGAVIKSFKEISDSRTGFGISKDGKTLYILIVEGEHKSRSKGLSYSQCADIFLRMGAYNAIELDGGSSTTLYIYNKNVLSYKKNPKIPAFLCFSKVLFDK